MGDVVLEVWDAWSPVWEFVVACDRAGFTSWRSDLSSNQALLAAAPEDGGMLLIAVWSAALRPRAHYLPSGDPDAVARGLKGAATKLESMSLAWDVSDEAIQGLAEAIMEAEDIDFLGRKRRDIIDTLVTSGLRGRLQPVSDAFCARGWDHSSRLVPQPRAPEPEPLDAEGTANALRVALSSADPEARHAARVSLRRAGDLGFQLHPTYRYITEVTLEGDLAVLEDRTVLVREEWMEDPELVEEGFLDEFGGFHGTVTRTGTRVTLTLEAESNWPDAHDPDPREMGLNKPLRELLEKLDPSPHPDA